MLSKKQSLKKAEKELNFSKNEGTESQVDKYKEQFMPTKEEEDELKDSFVMLSDSEDE